MEHVVTQIPKRQPLTPKPPPSSQRIIHNAPNLANRDSTSFSPAIHEPITIRFPDGRSTEVITHEREQFSGLDEFRVSVCSGRDQPEDVFGEGDGEELRERCTGDCGDN
jgi:hypothetical protein